MKFDINKNYKIDLTRVEGEFGTWFKISESIIPDLIRDGRVLGRVLENALCSIFDNFTLHKEEDYDVEVDGLKFELKSTGSNNGIHFEPSSMIGAGRKYDYELHKQKTEDLDYYLAIDRTNFPIIELITIESKIENVTMINARGNLKGNFTEKEWQRKKEQFKK